MKVVHREIEEEKLKSMFASDRGFVINIVSTTQNEFYNLLYLVSVLLIFVFVPIIFL